MCSLKTLFATLFLFVVVAAKSQTAIPQDDYRKLGSTLMKCQVLTSTVFDASFSEDCAIGVKQDLMNYAKGAQSLIAKYQAALTTKLGKDEYETLVAMANGYLDVSVKPNITSDEFASLSFWNKLSNMTIEKDFMK